MHVFVRSQITKKIYIYKYFSYFRNYIQYCADPSGQAGLRPLACWDYGFESSRGHMSVPCECCVLSGRSLCVGLITLPEDPYRVSCSVCVCVCVCVSKCDCEASIMRKPWPRRVLSPHGGKNLRIVRSVLDSIFILLVVISVTYIVKCQYIN
jgi:hypothetical protein